MLTAAPAPAVSADPAGREYLPDWPAGTKVGYVVCAPGGEGRHLRVAITDHGTLEVQGVGTYEIVETVPVAERRAGLAALHSGRI